MITATFDLSTERTDALLQLSSQPRPLALLIKLPDTPSSPFATRCLRACDYVYFLQSKWITEGSQIALTADGEQVVSTIRASRQRFAFGRFQAGDLVAVTGVKPVISRAGRVIHWEAQTDSEYRLNLYPEDFKALVAAGYDVPTFDSRITRTVYWEVYVSREPDTVTGWRIADIKPFTKEE